MGKPLRISVKGLKEAAIAFNTQGKTLEYLARSIGCTHQDLINFFTRRSISPRFFNAICANLGLQRGVIADFGADIQKSIPDGELNSLVQEVRNKVHASIQNCCGTIRVLNMTQPIITDSIYISVNVVEDFNRNQRRSIEKLLEGCEGEDFERFMLGCDRKRQERISALQAVECHDKLMILGKPGSGKTMFLKWLALQFNEGQINVDRVPFFINLKEFAEIEGQPSLQDFIIKQLTKCGVENGKVAGSIILEAGRAVILLDGLDEVKAQDYDRIRNTICHTANHFDRTQFVMTCRIPAKEDYFERFTEVTVTDFNHQQIADFAHKWFQPKATIKAQEFTKELKTNLGLQELATNPLLLTFLCLIFEEEGRFPSDRSKLYKEALDILL
jgi:predicted NACHT family NTPase